MVGGRASVLALGMLFVIACGSGVRKIRLRDDGGGQGGQGEPAPDDAGGQSGIPDGLPGGSSPLDSGGAGGAEVASGGAEAQAGSATGGAPSSVPAFALTVGYHVCALFDAGQVKCWGNNSAGELGLGDTNYRGDQPDEMGAALPAVDLGGGATVALAGGYEYNCALLETGDVKCWGFGSYGNLGLIPNTFIGDQPGEMGPALPSVDLGQGISVFAIAASLYQTCAILDAGPLKCWGANAHGELGLGDANDRGDEAGEMGSALPAVNLGAGRTAVAVTMGFNHTCALLDDASIKCWGQNDHGELGQGDIVERGSQAGDMDALSAIDLGDGRTALQVSAGVNHTCALLDDQQVKCWGDNGAGQLGYGDTNPRGDAPGELGNALQEVDLGTGRKAVAVSAGARHTCVLLDDGHAKCWGANEVGQLGLGDANPRGDEPDELGDALPEVDVGAGRAVLSIVAGGANTCAVLDDGTARCWGENSFGQLGQGDASARGDQAGELGDDLSPVDFGRAQP